jgi:DNA primase catalytic subunit
LRESWRDVYQDIEDVLKNPRDYSPKPYWKHLPRTILLARIYKDKLEEVFNRLMLSQPFETDTKEKALEKLDIHAELTMLDVEINSSLIENEDFM